MSLLIFCLRSVRMCKLSHSFNQCLEKHYPIALPTLMNTPDWTYLLKGFRIVPMSNLFFDVRVFNPLAKSHFNQSLSSCYCKNENEKKRAYEECIRNFEHGTFTSLVFSVAGDMGPIASTFYKCLASMLSAKTQQSYNQTICWISCSLSFSLIRSMVMCLRGARSSCGKP